MTIRYPNGVSWKRGVLTRAPVVTKWSVWACLISLGIFSNAHAQTMGISPVLAAPMPSAAQVGESPPALLTMPLVNAADGLRFQRQRQVAASDVRQSASPVVVAAPAATASSKPVTLEQSALGHALPTSSSTPLGFPRADFAIAKPGKGAATAVPATLDNATGVSQTVIQ